MALGTGLGNGFAFEVNYNDRINQLHKNEEFDRRAANEAAAKAKMFADDAEFQNAANSHDAPLIKEYSKGIIRKMGEYRRNNPDLMYNPDKLVEFNLLKRDLKDNPDLRRGMASDSAYKEYVKDLQDIAKNPQAYDEEAYKGVGDQWNNYLKYGNQNGQEAALKEGKKAFLYTKPTPFVGDLPGTLLKIGDGVKDYNVVKGKGIGEWWTEPKADQVQAAKQSAYSQYGRQIEVQARKLGLTTPEAIDKWVTDNISAGFKKNYNIGDANAEWERWYKMQQLGLEKDKLEAKKDKGNNYSVWKYLIDPKTKAGNLSEETVRKVWGDKPNMIIVGNSGAKADLTGLDWHTTQRFVKRNGIPFILGYTKVPLEVAKQKGIISGDDADIKSGDFSDNGVRITSDYIGQAAFEKSIDKNGNPKSYVKVSYNLPVDPKDQVAQQKFNAFNDVDKLVPASHDPYINNTKKAAPTGAQVDSKGNVFDSNGKYVGPISDFQ